MKIKDNFNMTLNACYLGYVTQAIINNFIPLLFLTFQKEYHISLEKTAMLISVNFGIQLLTDFLSAKYVDKIGYRISMTAAHIFAAVGLVGLGVFPLLFSNPYHGLLLSICLYALGGGLIEVLVSPIVEACPTERKETAMSLLHSFYCWGHVCVIILSTLFFVAIGVENWRYLACMWAIVPIINIALFMKVPIRVLVEEENGLSIGELCKNSLFWILILLMVCAGASEQGMSQWASVFAEDGLKVSKTIGDLMGPCFFAFMMGTSRLFYGKFGEKIKLRKFMVCSCLLCLASYVLAAMSPVPLFALIGCGLCGLSVGILWPGSFSMAAAACPKGGTTLFALLALAGDLGCALGPAVVGNVAGLQNGNLQTGILAAIAFPVLLILGIWRYHAQLHHA